MRDAQVNQYPYRRMSSSHAQVQAQPNVATKRPSVVIHASATASPRNRDQRSASFSVVQALSAADSGEQTVSTPIATGVNAASPLPTATTAALASARQTAVDNNSALRTNRHARQRSQGQAQPQKQQSQRLQPLQVAQTQTSLRRDSESTNDPLIAGTPMSTSDESLILSTSVSSLASMPPPSISTATRTVALRVSEIARNAATDDNMSSATTSSDENEHPTSTEDQASGELHDSSQTQTAPKKKRRRRGGRGGSGRQRRRATVAAAAAADVAVSATSVEAATAVSIEVAETVHGEISLVSSLSTAGHGSESSHASPSNPNAERKDSLRLQPLDPKVHLSGPPTSLSADHSPRASSATPHVTPPEPSAVSGSHLIVSQNLIDSQPTVPGQSASPLSPIPLPGMPVRSRQPKHFHSGRPTGATVSTTGSITQVNQRLSGVSPAHQTISPPANNRHLLSTPLTTPASTDFQLIETPISDTSSNAMYLEGAHSASGQLKASRGRLNYTSGLEPIEGSAVGMSLVKQSIGPLIGCAHNEGDLSAEISGVSSLPTSQEEDDSALIALSLISTRDQKDSAESPPQVNGSAGSRRDIPKSISSPSDHDSGHESGSLCSAPTASDGAASSPEKSNRALEISSASAHSGGSNEHSDDTMKQILRDDPSLERQAFSPILIPNSSPSSVDVPCAFPGLAHTMPLNISQPTSSSASAPSTASATHVSATTNHPVYTSNVPVVTTQSQQSSQVQHHGQQAQTTSALQSSSMLSAPHPHQAQSIQSSQQPQPSLPEQSNIAQTAQPPQNSQEFDAEALFTSAEWESTGFAQTAQQAIADVLVLVMPTGEARRARRQALDAVKSLVLTAYRQVALSYGVHLPVGFETIRVGNVPNRSKTQSQTQLLAKQQQQLLQQQLHYQLRQDYLQRNSSHVASLPEHEEAVSVSSLPDSPNPDKRPASSKAMAQGETKTETSTLASVVPLEQPPTTPNQQPSPSPSFGAAPPSPGSMQAKLSLDAPGSTGASTSSLASGEPSPLILPASHPCVFGLGSSSMGTFVPGADIDLGTVPPLGFSDETWFSLLKSAFNQQALVVAHSEPKEKDAPTMPRTVLDALIVQRQHTHGTAESSAKEASSGKQHSDSNESSSEPEPNCLPLRLRWSFADLSVDVISSTEAGRGLSAFYSALAFDIGRKELLRQSFTILKAWTVFEFGLHRPNMDRPPTVTTTTLTPASAAAAAAAGAVATAYSNALLAYQNSPNGSASPAESGGGTVHGSSNKHQSDVAASISALQASVASASVEFTRLVVGDHIPSAVLDVMVFYIINRYHGCVRGIFEVFCLFLEFYSQFDFKSKTITIAGIADNAQLAHAKPSSRLSSLNLEMTAEPLYSAEALDRRKESLLQAEASLIAQAHGPSPPPTLGNDGKTEYSNIEAFIRPLTIPAPLLPSGPVPQMFQFGCLNVMHPLMPSVNLAAGLDVAVFNRFTNAIRSTWTELRDRGLAPIARHIATHSCSATITGPQSPAVGSTLTNQPGLTTTSNPTPPQSAPSSPEVLRKTRGTKAATPLACPPQGPESCTAPTNTTTGPCAAIHARLREVVRSVFQSTIARFSGGASAGTTTVASSTHASLPPPYPAQHQHFPAHSQYHHHHGRAVGESQPASTSPQPKPSGGPTRPSNTTPQAQSPSVIPGAVSALVQPTSRSTPSATGSTPPQAASQGSATISSAVQTSASAAISMQHLPLQLGHPNTQGQLPTFVAQLPPSLATASHFSTPIVGNHPVISLAGINTPTIQLPSIVVPSNLSPYQLPQGQCPPALATTQVEPPPQNLLMPPYSTLEQAPLSTGNAQLAPQLSARSSNLILVAVPVLTPSSGGQPDTISYALVPTWHAQPPQQGMLSAVGIGSGGTLQPELSQVDVQAQALHSKHAYDATNVSHTSFSSHVQSPASQTPTAQTPTTQTPVAEPPAAVGPLGSPGASSVIATPSTLVSRLSRPSAATTTVVSSTASVIPSTPTTNRAQGPQARASIISSNSSSPSTGKQSDLAVQTSQVKLQSATIVTKMPKKQSNGTSESPAVGRKNPDQIQQKQLPPHDPTKHRLNSPSSRSKVLGVNTAGSDTPDLYRIPYLVANPPRSEGGTVPNPEGQSTPGLRHVMEAEMHSTSAIQRTIDTDPGMPVGEPVLKQWDAAPRSNRRASGDVLPIQTYMGPQPQRNKAHISRASADPGYSTLLGRIDQGRNDLEDEEASPLSDVDDQDKRLVRNHRRQRSRQIFVHRLADTGSSTPTLSTASSLSSTSPPPVKADTVPISLIQSTTGQALRDKTVQLAPSSKLATVNEKLIRAATLDKQPPSDPKGPQITPCRTTSPAARMSPPSTQVVDATTNGVDSQTALKLLSAEASSQQESRIGSSTSLHVGDIVSACACMKMHGHPQPGVAYILTFAPNKLRDPNTCSDTNCDCGSSLVPVSNSDVENMTAIQEAIEGLDAVLGDVHAFGRRAVLGTCTVLSPTRASGAFLVAGNPLPLSPILHGENENDHKIGVPSTDETSADQPHPGPSSLQLGNSAARIYLEGAASTAHGDKTKSALESETANALGIDASNGASNGDGANANDRDNARKAIRVLVTQRTTGPSISEQAAVTPLSTGHGMDEVLAPQWHASLHEASLETPDVSLQNQTPVEAHIAQDLSQPGAPPSTGMDCANLELELSPNKCTTYMEATESIRRPSYKHTRGNSAHQAQLLPPATPPSHNAQSTPTQLANQVAPFGSHSPSRRSKASPGLGQHPSSVELARLQEQEQSLESQIQQLQHQLSLVSTQRQHVMAQVASIVDPASQSTASNAAASHISSGRRGRSNHSVSGTSASIQQHVQSSPTQNQSHSPVAQQVHAQVVGSQTSGNASATYAVYPNGQLTLPLNQQPVPSIPTGSYAQSALSPSASLQGPPVNARPQVAVSVASGVLYPSMPPHVVPHPHIVPVSPVQPTQHPSLIQATVPGAMRVPHQVFTWEPVQMSSVPSLIQPNQAPINSQGLVITGSAPSSVPVNNPNINPNMMVMVPSNTLPYPPAQVVSGQAPSLQPLHSLGQAMHPAYTLHSTLQSAVSTNSPLTPTSISSQQIGAIHHHINPVPISSTPTPRADLPSESSPSFSSK